MSVNGQRKVVITGIGAVTPLGNDAETTWQRLLAGESGAGPITQFDSTDYNVHFACEVTDFDPSSWIERKAGPAHGSLCAVGPCGGSAGGG
jgi:3-oxoacyl-[acyl-carrier-protein] synthase II